MESPKTASGALGNFLQRLQARVARLEERGSIAGRMIDQTLIELLEGAQHLRNVFIVGATTRPEVMDSSIFKPSRFDELIYVPLPDRKSRSAIFKVKLSNAPVSKVDLISIIALSLFQTVHL